MYLFKQANLFVLKANVNLKLTSGKRYKRNSLVAEAFYYYKDKLGRNSEIRSWILLLSSRRQNTIINLKATANRRSPEIIRSVFYCFKMLSVRKKNSRVKIFENITNAALDTHTFISVSNNEREKLTSQVGTRTNFGVLGKDLSYDNDCIIIVSVF